MGTAVLLATAAVMTAGTPALAATGSSAAAHAAVTSTLTAGHQLTAGQSLTVASGEYRLTMQGDGNLVEYTLDNVPLWSSRTAGNAGARADMQGDGNLVVYSSANKALWASNTNAHAGAYLTLQSDGNTVVYSNTNKPLWAAGTNIVVGGSNDYPYANSSIDVSDGAGFLTRECTSFVAWRIRHNLKIADFSNGWRGGWFGHAGTWVANARNLGLVVNSTPAVNSVAVLPAGVDGAGSMGHVGFVLGVGNGTVDVEDYNYADSYDGYQYYSYSRHTIATAGLSFIHFR
ncbi:CHAP domain-containing protein [Streptomyces sp. NBC_00453]|uniref:CHAP domain-containing protein n=2 Tax=unclassified Streptomyces TaxID=2593676 RepID=UPI002E1C7E85